MTGHSEGRAAREAACPPGIGELAVKFLDSMPVAVFISVPGGRPLYANPEAVRLLGGRLVMSAAAADIAETYQIRERSTGTPYPTERLTSVAALAGQASTHDDMEVHQPDGTVVPVQTWGTPVTGPDGAVQYAIAAFADVTERVRTQEALRASEDRFRATMEILPDGFAILSAVRDGRGDLVDFRYDYMNEAGWQISQRVREEILGAQSHRGCPGEPDQRVFRGLRSGGCHRGAPASGGLRLRGGARGPPGQPRIRHPGDEAGGRRS